jgi:hypothetical protein
VSDPVPATPYSFCWSEGSLQERAMNLVRSMAAVKCKNKYPKGVIGAEARAHYSEARNIDAALASADTHPKDGDSTEIEAPLVSGAVTNEDSADAHD